MNNNKICISKRKFNVYTLIIVLFVLVLIYIFKDKLENMANTNLNSVLTKNQLLKKLNILQDDLHTTQVKHQQCERDLSTSKNYISKLSNMLTETSSVAIGSHDLVPPVRLYPQGRFGIPKYDDYQQIGYVYKDDVRFPLYGRYRYPGRSDRWEYYIIDETRNRLKIPFDINNYQEIFDDDSINIPTLGDHFRVKLYDYLQFRYNPNIF